MTIPTDMLLALYEPDRPPMCNAHTWSIWGHITHTCTRRDAHEVHLDAHTGGRWRS